MDQRFETVVIGGGQAGLAAAYHLSLCRSIWAFGSTP